MWHHKTAMCKGLGKLDSCRHSEEQSAALTAVTVAAAGGGVVGISVRRAATRKVHWMLPILRLHPARVPNYPNINENSQITSTVGGLSSAVRRASAMSAEMAHPMLMSMRGLPASPHAASSAGVTASSKLCCTCARCANHPEKAMKTPGSCCLEPRHFELTFRLPLACSTHIAGVVAAADQQQAPKADYQS